MKNYRLSIYEEDKTSSLNACTFMKLTDISQPDYEIKAMVFISNSEEKFISSTMNESDFEKETGGKREWKKPMDIYITEPSLKTILNSIL